MYTVGAMLTTSSPGREVRSIRSDAASPASKGRILVVDQHALLATGIQAALHASAWEVEMTIGGDADDVLDAARRMGPDCVLLGTNFGTNLGTDLTAGVRRAIELIPPLVSSGAAVVVLTAERRRAVLAECLEAGAAGWISPAASMDDIDTALQDVVAGRAVVGRSERAMLMEVLRSERAREGRTLAMFGQLTRRESLVLCGLLDGLSAEEIAEQHFVALTTVRSQIRSILRKLGVRSQLAAVSLAESHRDLLPDDAQSGRDRRRSPRRESTWTCASDARLASARSA